MSTVKLEVCSCCAMSEQHVAEAIARIRAEHGAQVEIIERECLDVCQESAAVKLDGEVMLLKESDVPALEAKIRQASARSPGISMTKNAMDEEG